MSINQFNTTLRVPLRPSRRLLGAAIAISCLGFVCIGVSGLSVLIKLLLMLALCAYAAIEYRAGKRMLQWRQLQRDAAGNWWLIDDTGRRWQVTPGRRGYCSQHLAVIDVTVNHLPPARGARRMLFWVWRYQHPQDVFRRLALHWRMPVTDP